MRVLFAVFLFCYLLFSQSSLITLAQHQLSQGQTSYNSLVGALVLTSLLYGLQRLVSRFVHFRSCLYVLSFFPSASIAVLLTAFTPEVHIGVIVVTAILWIVWLYFVWNDSVQGGWKVLSDESNSVMPHVIGLFFLAFFMGVCGNSNDVITYEIKTAKALNHQNYHKALKIGNKSLATSQPLTAMRAFALAHYENGLPDELFKYPLPEGGCDMLYVHPGDTLNQLFSPDSLYQFIGCRPANDRLTPFEYFEKSVQRRPNGPARDYWLCALLLDKKLDRFAEELPHYYAVSDSVVLPHFYAEAMILYVRLCSNPVARYTDPNIAANYLDFKEKEEKIPNYTERKNLLWRDYGDTYWWYYFYHK